MKEGEKLVKIEVIISEQSFKDYFKGKDIDHHIVFEILNRHFDVNQVHISRGNVRRSRPQLITDFAGNSHLITKKGWDKEE